VLLGFGFFSGRTQTSQGSTGARPRQPKPQQNLGKRFQGKSVTLGRPGSGVGRGGGRWARPRQRYAPGWLWAFHFIKGLTEDPV